MGRLTEYIEYLKVKPKDLEELKENLHHLTITEEMKKERSRLKMYK